MDWRTKLYVALVASLATVLVAMSWSGWESRDEIRFIGFLSIALLASTFKVRIPGLEGTYTLNFLVLLAGVYELSLLEVLLIAVGSAVVQSFWRAARRPTPIQVLFNASNLAISVAGAYGSLRLLGVLTTNWLVLSGGIAALTYYILNTGLTTVVLQLVHGGELKQIWKHWSFYALPYYLLGSTLSSVWASGIRDVHWPSTSMAGFALYLMFRLLRTSISTERLLPQGKISQ